MCPQQCVLVYQGLKAMKYIKCITVWFQINARLVTSLSITKHAVLQGCMSLSTFYLEYSRHAERILDGRRCRRVYAPTSNTASCDSHEQINSWASFTFLYGYGAPLGAPLSDLRGLKLLINSYLTYTHLIM